MAVFLTGATGFLGTEVASELIWTTDEDIYVLVRGRDTKEALHRLKTFWYDQKEIYQEIGRRIIPLAGDFTRPDLGLAPSVISMLRGRISRIYHVGAETGIQKSRRELMTVNRRGTACLLRFARMIDAGGSLRRFIFVSTAYTAGLRTGRILETDPLPEKYATYYEESKGLAEKLVRSYGLPYTIFRPGMIVGNSENGRIRNFNTIYYVLKLMLQGKLGVIPVSEDQKLNIVPVDYVAEAIVKISLMDQAENACFHLTPSEEMKPTAGELADMVRTWAEDHLQLKLARPRFVPLPALKKAGLTHNRKRAEKKKNMVSNLTALMPYFYDDHIFDRTGTDRLLGPYQMEWRDYLDPLLTYACRHNFLHQTDRSVFEQVLYRLQSTSAPISYYDVSADAMKETKGSQMIGKIQQIRAGLLKMGVRKGDRIALTGSNCTDYFCLDTAIGLCGCVSVPIYYTTPCAEIDLLLEKSGAKWFFIGDKRIMKQVDDLKSPIPVIAFFNALEVPAGRRPFTRWQEFLGQEKSGGSGSTDGDQAAASGSGDAGQVYVDPEDLATIRYTSGTTGEPKGVMFQAGQLAWMGQVLTDLLPWKEKQAEMRYLSFLPLSHVVEGILASYAPYYVHCPVKFYYLNDFDQLTAALPRIRPTVFFSVPRFYEKLWQQIEENPIGQRWLKAQEGPGKKVLGRILKRAVLKKAGLDQCSQLIVGSAPISEELLLHLRQLGIEVHNAYGQTEAPLITINRLGDNKIPSIGTPLPDTRVTVAEDGELIIEGPQVCQGYYRLEADTVKDGVLKSGDLGRIDESGHIYLIGRKKEMIITSYGKNINCPKIEERLKNITGISEAVLIGENRPYCTALLWMDQDASAAPAWLADEIDKMNQHLSHPEQIRRWTLIQEPLSIRKGELTPNLKVKRAVVQDHYRDTIESMYQ